MRFLPFFLSFALFFSPITWAASDPSPPEKDKDHEQMSPASLRTRGYIAHENGDFDQAIVYYKKAILLAPKYPLPYNDMGILHEKMGLPNEAEAYYLEALRADPTYIKAHANLAMLYESVGRLDEAKDRWEKRAKLGETADAWTAKALERLEVLEHPEKQVTHRHDEGVFLVKDKAQALAHYNEGLHFESQGNVRKALVHLAKSLDFDPWNQETLESIRRIRESLDAERSKNEPAKGPDTPLSQLFLTTSDINTHYDIIGVITAEDDQGSLEALNLSLRRRALAQGADGLILVHYLSHKDKLHGYGTAVRMSE